MLHIHATLISGWLGGWVCDYLEIVLSTTWYDNEEGGKKNLSTSKSKTIQS